MNAGLLRAVAPYLIGAAALAAIVLGVRWYGHSQFAAGQAACQEAQRVAGLEEFKSEAERLTGLSADLQDRIDTLAATRPKIIERYTREIIDRPLPAGCILDAGRLRRINDGIGTANAAGQRVDPVPAGPVPAD
ncbi:hypothetical protein BER2_2994 [plant metagenome]|uniref:Uncharacterized protein n=1 Tax=plant metagenome TaxID=1297885 RepID=A0A484Q368_9ZZZZ